MVETFLILLGISLELILIMGIAFKRLATSVDATKQELRAELDQYAEQIPEAIGLVIQDVMTGPMAKRAMSILGKKSGEVRGENAAVEDIATDALNSGDFAGIKMMAETMGFDVDAYIEKHGAVNTIKAVNQLGSVFGFDIKELMQNNLSGSLSRPSGGGAW